MAEPGALPQALAELARKAGQAIMAVFNTSQFDIEHKADNSPVTCADIAAHDIIAARLPQLLDLPILSEEGANHCFSERHSWQRYWLIDPLDGTREFIAGRDEFTVNIALIDEGRPLLGVVYCPPRQEMYVGCLSREFGSVGAFQQLADSWLCLPAHPPAEAAGMRVVTGHRQVSAGETRLLDALAQMGQNVSLTRLGSSLKLCALAAGEFDFYPRLGPTSEWDTAAGQAVLEAAGGAVVDAGNLHPLAYNTGKSLLNPEFWALAHWTNESQQRLWHPLFRHIKTAEQRQRSSE